MNKKLQKAYEEIEDQEEFLNEHKNRMNLSKEAEKELQRILEDEKNNKDQLNKNLNLIQDEKDKLSQRLREQEDEILEKVKQLG